MELATTKEHAEARGRQYARKVYRWFETGGKEEGCDVQVDGGDYLVKIPKHLEISIPFDFQDDFARGFEEYFLKKGIKR